MRNPTSTQRKNQCFKQRIASGCQRFSVMSRSTVCRLLKMLCETYPGYLYLFVLFSGLYYVVKATIADLLKAFEPLVCNVRLIGAIQENNWCFLSEHGLQIVVYLLTGCIIGQGSALVEQRIYFGILKEEVVDSAS